MKRRILFVSHSSELYGAERTLLQILQGLDRNSFEPLLVVPRPGPLEEAAGKRGIETRVVPFKWWLTEKGKAWKQPLAWVWNLRSVIRLGRLIRSWEAHLVFSNSTVQFGGALAARWKKVPHVWSVHEILEGESSSLRFLFGGRALARMVSALSAVVLVNSEATAAPFADRSRVRRVYPGLEADRLGGGRREKARQTFGLEPGDFVVGTVGRIYPGKGQLELVEAVLRAAESEPRIRLLVVGEIRHRKYGKKIRNFLARSRFRDRVILTGFQAGMGEVLAALDLMVIPSRVESFGLSVLEAMAAGVPVLAVRRGGIPEIITAGEDGVLVDAPDPREISRAILALVRDPERTRRLALNARKKVAQKFSLSRQVRETEAVLRECLSRPEGRRDGREGP